MHLPSTRLLGRYAAGLLAYAATPIRAASGTLEVDLVFPQNDTYAPAPIIPIAFAFQNSALAGFLQPHINFLIYPHGNSTGVAHGSFNTEWANFTKSDPYMLYGTALEALNSPGVWELHWTLAVTNCSAAADGHLAYALNSTRRILVFTTAHGAKRPDLAAATTAHSCADAQAYAFDIAETRDTGSFYDNGRPCAVLAEPAPTPSPCAVKIEAAAAASVSASMTDRACITQNRTWCPEPAPKDDGAAHGLAVPSLAAGGAALLAAAVGGLGFLVI